MLDAALAWAARGFRVFPLAAGTKDTPLVSHVDDATSDPARIRALWTDPVFGHSLDHNVGVATTGMVLIDIDVRHGKRGVENFLALAGAFDTLTIRTPSGGFHCYYRGEDVQGRVGILGKDSGLDVRSWHNYAVAPGSVTAEGVYGLEIDAPVVDVPAAFKPHLRPPLARAEGVVGTLTETPAMIDRATAFLQSAEPAVEGQGGDSRTFETAARMRDFGLTELTAVRLLWEVYNPRCVPPWTYEDIQIKAANAYAYGTAQFGQLAPELHYGNVEIPAEPNPPPPPSTIVGDDVFRFGNAVEPLSISPRPWLFRRLLMLRQTTMLVGAGATGKSTKALTIAAHLAMGKSYTGYLLKDDTPKRSIIYNEEDDIEEQSRRLWAICAHFKFDFPTVRERVALVSRDQIPLVLVEGDRPPKLNGAHVAALIKAASPDDVALLAIGPLVSIHQAPEEDNVAMAYVMGTLRLIAEKANVALLVDHHIGKSSGKGLLQDMYAARGAGAIVNAARIGFNLSTPSTIDAQPLGIDKDEAHLYVAMADAKMNLALGTHAFKWFKKTTVRLPNGDEVGVLDPYDMIGKGIAVATSQASTLAAQMKGRAIASCTVADAAAMLKAGDLLCGKMTLTQLRPIVVSILAAGVDTEEGHLKLLREIKGGKEETLVVLE